jgi:hypothetical protein
VLVGSIAMASDTAVFSLGSNRFQRNRSLTGRRDSSLSTNSGAGAGITPLKPLRATHAPNDNNNVTAGTSNKACFP